MHGDEYSLDLFGYFIICTYIKSLYPPETNIPLYAIYIFTRENVKSFSLLYSIYFYK